MPVECSIVIQPVDQDRFHAIDKVVMGHAFDIHNTIGRFCDERIYQDELARRCSADGMEVEREVQLKVTHVGFSKRYFVDMLVERGAVYELKTVESLKRSHQNQVINYLLLAGIHHGKLVNFRPASVESRFVSTRLSPTDRSVFTVEDGAWQGGDSGSMRLRETVSALLSNWGAFLDVNLYKDAVLHYMGGMEHAVRPIAIEVDGRVVGTQSMCMLSDNTAWHISAIRREQGRHEMHLRRLLGHMPLQCVQWINLNGAVVTLKTVAR